MRTSSVRQREPSRGARFVAILMVLVLIQPSWGQSRNSDTIEQLRFVLKSAATDAATRDRLLKTKVAQLTTLGEMGRALALSEWHDTKVDGLPQIDQANQAILLARFTQSMHAVLQKAEPNSILVALEILTELSKASKGLGEAGNFASAFATDVAHLGSEGPPTLRAAVARTLGLIEPDVATALPILTTLVHDADPTTRRAAAIGLASMLQGLNDAANQTQHLAQTPANKPARIAAACGSLLAVRDAGLIDPSPAVRLECVRVVRTSTLVFDRLIIAPLTPEEMEGTDRAASIQGAQAEVEDIRPLANAIRDASIVLSGRLRDGDKEIRLLAYKTFVELSRARWRWLRQRNGLGITDDDPLLVGITHGLEALNAAPSDPDLMVRRTAMEALELLGAAAAPAVPGLTKALSDPDRFVRWMAVRTLGNLGSIAHSSSLDLTRALNDADLDVRLAAALALEKVNAPEKTTGKHAPVAWAVDTASAAPNSARITMSALIESLHAKDAVMRLAALKTIRSMGTQAQPAIRDLTAALRDADDRVRCSAAETLGALGPMAREAVDALKAALTDGNEEVRRAASDALLSVTK